MKQVIGVLVLLLIGTIPVRAEMQRAFEDYATGSDSASGYEFQRAYYNLLYTTYIIELTSQEWHSDAVEPEQWQHWLVIVEPRLLGEYTEYLPVFSLVRSRTALLYAVRGDANHNDRPEAASSEAVRLALQHNAVVAELHAVPIGPVWFRDEQEDEDWWDDLNPFDDDEEGGRSEDSLVARSLDLALSEDDVTWAAPAPMTRAVLLAMDSLQSFLRQRYWGWPLVQDFVLTGHSKRGWVLWLAAALDDRVAGIAPLSYDNLNLSAQNDFQEQCWGAPGDGLEDYAEFDLYERLETAQGLELVGAIDPYAWRDRLGGPILMMVGTGDPYSVVDAAGLYLDDLPGQVQQYTVPNAGHDIRGDAGVEQALDAFFGCVRRGENLPSFTWQAGPDGLWSLAPQEPPVQVLLWTATNASARDFRQASGVVWTSAPVAADAAGVWQGAVALPARGYRAFFVELTYEDTQDPDQTYALSTPVQVIGPGSATAAGQGR